MDKILIFLKTLNPLTLALAGLGIAIIVIVLVVNAVQLRRARARDSQITEREIAPTPVAYERVEPSFHARPSPTPTTAQPARAALDESREDTEIAFGGVQAASEPVFVPTPQFSEPVASTNTPQTGEMKPLEPSLALPTAQEDPPLVAPGGPREPTAPIDGRVHSIVKLRFDHPLSAEQAKAIVEPVAAAHKRSHAWMWSTQSGAWAAARSPAAGAHGADAIAFAMPLATRSGAVTESTLREWMSTIEQQGHTHGAEVVYAPVNDDAKRAVELDQFCGNLDLMAGVTLMRADRSAIAGTRVRGTLEAEGFRLAPEGYFELVADDGVHPIYEIRSTHGQPMTGEALRHDGVHGLSLNLDVMRVANPVQQFDLMKSLAKRLATRLEATIVDDRGHALTDALFAQIKQELEKRVTAARTAGIEPGSPLARTLFGD
jgi:hypothetical protein